MAKSDIKLTTSRSWQDSYAAAIRWTKSEEPVQTAETEIHKKTAVLSQDHGGTPEEREALVNSLSRPQGFAETSPPHRSDTSSTRHPAGNPRTEP
jgi:hypothetical protein